MRLSFKVCSSLILSVFPLSVSADALSIALEKAHLKAVKELGGPVVACEVEKDGKYVILTQDQCLKHPAARKEVKLVKKFLAKMAESQSSGIVQTKALGPVNLGEQMLKQTFLVNHSWPEVTRRYFGFGPEDDPAYDYKKSQYYPTGTIKVNLTERAYQTIELYFDYIVPKYGENSAEARGLMALLGMMIFHETMHGWQLHTEPVRDYKRLPPEEFVAMLDNRQVAPDVLYGSVRIVEYEEDANVFTYEYMARSYEDFKAFENAFAQVKDEAWLLEKYPWLGGNYYDYYVFGQLKSAQKAAEKLAQGEHIKTFDGLSRYSYLVQSLPLQAFDRMVKINDAIASGADAAEFEAQVRQMYDEVMEVIDPDYGPLDPNSHEGKTRADAIRGVEGSMSGIKEVKAAVRKEFAMYEQAAGVKL